MQWREGFDRFRKPALRSVLHAGINGPRTPPRYWSAVPSFGHLERRERRERRERLQLRLWRLRTHHARLRRLQGSGGVREETARPGGARAVAARPAASGTDAARADVNHSCQPGPGQEAQTTHPDIAAARAGLAAASEADTNTPQRREPMKTIGLVSCTRSKLHHEALARELYMPSALFRKARAYCEQTYDEWYVLSAKYGLVHPATKLDPYDVTLNNMPVQERRAWGARVWEQLQPLLPAELFLHAGARYRDPLTPFLERSGVAHNVPLEGLGIGKQLQWYDVHGVEGAG